MEWRECRAGGRESGQLTGRVELLHAALFEDASNEGDCDVAAIDAASHKLLGLVGDLVVVRALEEVEILHKVLGHLVAAAVVGQVHLRACGVRA